MCFHSRYFLYFPRMPHLFGAALIYPVPALAGVGNRGEEIKVCLALEALCAGILRGSPSFTPVLESCHVLKTLQDF